MAGNKRPKNWEEEVDEQPQFTIGSYQRIGTGKSKLRRIGFIRERERIADAGAIQRAKRHPSLRVGRLKTREGR